MILARTAALVAMLFLPQPAPAITLDDLAGRWSGEGSLTLDDDPAQRLRCRIRLEPMSGGRSFFTGRCATAQAAQSFTYMLAPAGEGGLIVAENRSVRDDSLPDRMQGQLDATSLRFEGEDGALFELVLTAGALEFRLEGSGPEGFARGRASLARESETAEGS